MSVKPFTFRFRNKEFPLSLVAPVSIGTGDACKIRLRSKALIEKHAEIFVVDSEPYIRVFADVWVTDQHYTEGEHPLPPTASLYFGKRDGEPLAFKHTKPLMERPDMSNIPESNSSVVSTKSPAKQTVVAQATPNLTVKAAPVKATLVKATPAKQAVAMKATTKATPKPKATKTPARAAASKTPKPKKTKRDPESEEDSDDLDFGAGKENSKRKAPQRGQAVGATPKRTAIAHETPYKFSAPKGKRNAKAPERMGAVDLQTFENIKNLRATVPYSPTKLKGGVTYEAVDSGEVNVDGEEYTRPTRKARAHKQSKKVDDGYNASESANSDDEEEYEEKEAVSEAFDHEKQALARRATYDEYEITDDAANDDVDEATDHMEDPDLRENDKEEDREVVEKVTKEALEHMAEYPKATQEVEEGRTVKATSDAAKEAVGEDANEKAEEVAQEVVEEAPEKIAEDPQEKNEVETAGEEVEVGEKEETEEPAEKEANDARSFSQALSKQVGELVKKGFDARIGVHITFDASITSIPERTTEEIDRITGIYTFIREILIVHPKSTVKAIGEKLATHYYLEFTEEYVKGVLGRMEEADLLHITKKGRGVYYSLSEK